MVKKVQKNSKSLKLLNFGREVFVNVIASIMVARSYWPKMKKAKA